MKNFSCLRFLPKAIITAACVCVLTLMTTTTASADNCWKDLDGKGYGDPNNGVTCLLGCGCEPDLVDNNLDCDDTNPNIRPGAHEICDGIDNNCNGNIDEAGGTVWYADADNDGYGDVANPTLACNQPNGYVDNDLDCDDTDPGTNPGATDIPNDDGSVNVGDTVFLINFIFNGGPGPVCPPQN
jgi:hypothetical protein